MSIVESREMPLDQNSRRREKQSQRETWQVPDRGGRET